MFMRFFVLAGTAMHMSVMLVTPASAQNVDAPEITRWPAPPKWPSFKVRARRVMCGGHAGTPST